MSSWTQWAPDEDCKNYQLIWRRQCIANFTSPACEGSRTKLEKCDPLVYSNDSKASGSISFTNPRMFGQSISALKLAEEMAKNREKFLQGLILSMKFLMYRDYDFDVRTVNILDITITPKQPPVSVIYDVTMERTKKNIWQTNPVARATTINFMDFELDTEPSLSTIKGIYLSLAWVLYSILKGSKFSEVTKNFFLAEFKFA